MARYRSKDDTDLTWNRTRRQITRDLDTQIANLRENLLNQVLTAAWDKHVAALESGHVIALQDVAATWVEHELTRALGAAVAESE